MYLWYCRYAYKTKNHMSYFIQKYSHSHTLLEHQAEHDIEQTPKCAMLWARQRPIPRHQHQHRLPVLSVLELGWFVYKVNMWHVLSGSTAEWAPQGSSTWKWHYSVTGMGWLASFYNTEATNVQKYFRISSVLHTGFTTEFITKWRLPLFSLFVLTIYIETIFKTYEISL